MNNLYQITGVAFLVAAGVLGWRGEIGYGWLAFGAAGLITASCAIWNEWVSPTRTVSQWIQDLTANKVVDYIIGSAIITFAACQHFILCGRVDLSTLSSFNLGMTMAFWPLAIGLLIHFFANRD